MDNRQRFFDVYKLMSAISRDTLAGLVGASEIDALESDAAREFEALLGDIPYADRPGHLMAFPALGTAIMLAFYKAARARGCSAHQFGRAIQEAPLPELPPPDPERYRREAAASQESAAANEFVFEFLEGDGAELDFGYDIKACAICHLYLQHDAMDLVPYICALDDKWSAARDSGLRRTGAIALGARRCDFRYRAGGEPLTLASQYGDRVRLVDEGEPHGGET
jgi:hypothetical protein